MPASAPPKPIDPVPPQLPEEEFWEKYNERLEFPLSTVGAVFLHVLVALLLFLILAYLIGKGEDRSSVGVTFVDVGGLDDSGLGSEGSGGDEIVGITGDPLRADFVRNPDLRNLPDAQANQQPSVSVNDPNVAAPNTTTSAFSKVDDTLNSKKNGAGSNPGSGKPAAGGAPGTKGTGPGGSGNDRTRARQENWSRWVISFSTFENDGRDYINQIGAFGGTLVVPRPGGTEYLVYDDVLHALNSRTLASKDAERAYASYIWFSEDPAKYNDAARKAKSNRVIGEVSRALKLDFTPDKFWAVFPKEVDALLAQKETDFIRRVRAETRLTNLSVDDIHTTVFAVDRLSGGKEVQIVQIRLNDGRTRVIVRNNRLIVE
ncbi:MAG TPA: hypothetical protein VKE74_13470 [Gemmataceae bacterium]|nr:hypothetical protein [Gemmataceae bacterium]